MRFQGPFLPFFKPRAGGHRYADLGLAQVLALALALGVGVVHPPVPGELPLAEVILRPGRNSWPTSSAW